MADWLADERAVLTARIPFTALGKAMTTTTTGYALCIHHYFSLLFFLLPHAARINIGVAKMQ